MSKIADNTAPNPSRRGLHDLAAGVCAGVVGTAFGHPLDTVKVRLQTQGMVRSYTGMVDCFVKIVKQEGTSSLFRGIASPMLSLTILNAISFGTYGHIKAAMRTHLNDNKPLTHAHHVLAGAAVGALSTVVSTPFEMVKVRLQLDNVQEKRFKGSIHAARYLVREYGFTSLYAGFWVNTWREILFCALYFGVYETAKSSMRKAFYDLTGTDQQVVSILIAGGLSGMAGWFGSFPLDTVKSNIQGQTLTKPYKQSLRMHSVALAQYRAKGIVGLYSGVGPALAGALIVSVKRISAYECNL
eukprot:TRINITY_DN8530_c0_g1_i1.p1 TRINITY_DN8530_c0_g1~~TRINITY_DN8530_c0_g1_i1.p1  ORF type:complete len:299 (+),score=17.88 TRINITY_DN8530_c0_g1_i1:158-1054(+)